MLLEGSPVPGLVARHGTASCEFVYVGRGERALSGVCSRMATPYRSSRNRERLGIRSWSSEEQTWWAICRRGRPTTSRAAPATGRLKWPDAAYPRRRMRQNQANRYWLRPGAGAKFRQIAPTRGLTRLAPARSAFCALLAAWHDAGNPTAGTRVDWLNSTRRWSPGWRSSPLPLP